VRFKVLSAVLVSGVLAAGCGGGGAPQSNKGQIQDTTKTFIDALRDGDNAKACTVTTDPGGCLSDLALAQGFLGKNGSWNTLFPDGWKSKMGKAKIVVHGSTATMAAFSASGQDSNSDPTKFKKVDGEWKLDMSDNSSSSSDQQSATPQAPDGAVLRTDAQAEANLKTNLKTWDGIDLAKADFVDATCSNGYYSKTETRTGKHLPGFSDQTNAAGEDIFPSFGCELLVGNRSFGLYVIPQAGGGWTVAADR
jgi:hypothetical protein